MCAQINPHSARTHTSREIHIKLILMHSGLGGDKVGVDEKGNANIMKEGEKKRERSVKPASGNVYLINGDSYDPMTQRQGKKNILLKNH